MINRLPMAGALAAALLCAGPARAGIEVDLSGVEGAERDNIESRLAIRAAADRDDLDEIQVRNLHRQAESDIRGALQPFGYYEPHIEPELAGKAPDWTVRYHVDLGPRTLIRTVAVQISGEAAGQPVVERAREILLALKDAPLLHERYEAAKTGLQQAAYNGGFLDAAFTKAELRVKPSAQSAEVTLVLTSGPRYFFGPVTLQTQNLDEEFLRRYVHVESGLPFDPQKVLDTQFALSDLDYFQSVEIVPLREQITAAREIPLEIRTTPRPRRRYEIGAGYGTDSGARLTAALEVRRIGRTGHKLRGEMQLSEQKRSYGGEYRIPLGRRAGESFNLTGTRAEEKFVDGGESLKYTVGGSLTRTPGDWQRRLYLEYAFEESRIGDDFDKSDLLIPGLSINRTETDDTIHTRRGWSVFADAHGAHETLLSSASFFQLRGLARGALPLGPRARLLGRAELGANFVGELSTLPATQRFFAGGDQSVRGYSYQSIGPRDADGRVIGGEYLSAFSVEADYRLIGALSNWGLAVFADAGGANDDPGPELSAGVGAGVRYWAPIGFVNVDVAHPLDRDYGSGLRLHISVRVGL